MALYPVSWFKFWVLDWTTELEKYLSVLLLGALEYYSLCMVHKPVKPCLPALYTTLMALHMYKVAEWIRL